MADRTVRWAILGPGQIAHKVAKDFPLVTGAELVAVGSRSAQRATEFATEYDIEHAYGSYEELLAESDVDVVYVATPHTAHLANGLAALRNDKAILVEKSFAATLDGARQLADEARRRGLFAMEAMWTRFQPAIVHARELIANGAIGQIRSVQADLGVIRPYDAASRVFRHSLGGGSMLDLGVYPISFSQMLLGDPVRVTTQGSLESSQVDAEFSMLLEFTEGRTATVMCSLHSPMPGHARIFGTQGWIDVLPRFHHPTEIVVHKPESEDSEITAMPLGGGYAHELQEVTDALLAGRTESQIMPLADTLAVQSIMQTGLDQLGVPRFSE
jgi:predicted dehydrogenase